MLRLSELALLLLPLLAYIAWRAFGGGRPLPGQAVAAVGCALALLAAALIWFGLGHGLPRNAPYVPAHLGADSRIVEPGSSR